MTLNKILRRFVPIGTALTLAFLTGLHAVAQAPTAASKGTAPTAGASPATGGAAKTQDFVGTTVNMAANGNGERLRIALFKWSSDAERTQLVSAYQKGPDAFLDALKAMPTAGYVWTGESVGYTVRYTYRKPLPAGGERLVLATDRLLGSSSGKPWTASTESAFGSYPFTLIELRVAGNGRGEGKMSLNAKVTANQTDKTIELENFEGSRVLLRNVQREAPTP
jgi:hypothetical protein